MLALITERLQNQRLDDAHSQRSANIQLITAQGINFTGTKPSESPDQNPKVWSSCHEGKKRCVNRHKSGGDGKGPSRHHSGGESKGQYGGLCFHRRPLLTCAVCSSQNATPPKKKHCRSLSIPADSVSVQAPWKPKGSCLWKPIAVCPMTLHPKQHKNKPYSPSLNREVRGSRAASSLGCVALRDACMPGYHTPCDFNTPPESPVPRPASASSGFCDGSFSPIGAPWLELSPSRSSHRSDSFKHRSLSMEDRISATPSVSVTSSPSPSSPCRHKIPRCRSQPCFLHDRKCGLKRRRDHDRPTLNLRKMAETAYPPEHLNHVTPPITQFTDYKSLGSSMFRPSRFWDDLHTAANLVPIASSPLDTEIPMKGAEFPKASPIKEVGHLSKPTWSEDSGCSEVDETEEALEGCPCYEDPEDGYHQATELFPIADLDVEEIESH